MNRILIFDGSYCAVRAKSTTGHLTNGTVYGILRMAKALVDDLKPEHVVFVFDKGLPRRRMIIYPEYKSQRYRGRSERTEVGVAQTALHSLGCDIVEIENVEADDIIGVLSSYFKEIYDEIVIVASDSDLFQLIDEKTKIYNPMTKILIDEKEFAKNYEGLKPTNMIDMKCISGDTSDNIPGIPGLGPKSAIKIIKTIGNVNNLPNNTLVEKLSVVNQNIDLIKRNLQLVKIPREIQDLEESTQNIMSEIITKLESHKIDKKSFADLIKQMNFNSINVDQFVKSFDFETKKKLDGWLI